MRKFPALNESIKERRPDAPARIIEVVLRTPKVRNGGGFQGRTIDLDVLRVLARLSQHDAVAARDLAAALGRPVQAITPKVLSLVKAGLASRHRGPDQIETGSYTMTRDGYDYLRRLADHERRIRSAQ